MRETLDTIKAEMRSAGILAATRDASQIILGEVLNNVVEHAYTFAEGHPIDLSIWVKDTGLNCRVRDHGAPMPNGVPPAGITPNIDTASRDDLPEGGFGWAMVWKLTEDLQYFRAEGVNELVFRIPHAQP